jgi:hypothetical protein
LHEISYLYEIASNNGLIHKIMIILLSESIFLFHNKETIFGHLIDGIFCHLIDGIFCHLIDGICCHLIDGIFCHLIMFQHFEMYWKNKMRKTYNYLLFLLPQSIVDVQVGVFEKENWKEDVWCDMYHQAKTSKQKS